MDKALSEMNTKELFCALTGEYGPIRQAYVQTAFRKYKEQHGEYAELTEMIRLESDKLLSSYNWQDTGLLQLPSVLRVCGERIIFLQKAPGLRQKGFGKRYFRSQWHCFARRKGILVQLCFLFNRDCDILKPVS